MLAISPVKNNNQPSFGIYFHTVKDNMHNVVYRGDTRLFRDDIDWNNLVDFIDNKYRNKKDAQIIMHACSDGEEVYSLLAVLIERLGAGAEKYFPVIAKDIDPWHISLAQKGVYDMASVERPDASYYTRGNFSKYFYEYNNGKYSVVEPKEFLKKKVQFSTGDILEDIKVLPLKNKILFARNFMPYLDKEDAYAYVKTLAQNADDSTTLVIGGYDKEFDRDKLLENFGFNRTHTDCVYELKKSLKYLY